MIRRAIGFARRRALALAANTLSFPVIWAIVQDKLKAETMFEFRGASLPYLFHSHNNFGFTERSVEMPIVRSFLTERPWKRVLEIGNVTAYYENYFSGLFPNKVVVDKIEHDWKVVTMDIADYSDDEGFDFIFSVSTFEHMDADLGRNPDYRPSAAKSVSIACDNLRHVYTSLLRPGGVFVVTAPLGYTPEWDATFFSSDLEHSGFSILTRYIVSREGMTEWRTATTVASGDYRCDDPFPYANHVSVLEIRKSV